MKINKIVDSHAPLFSSIVRRVVEIQANGMGGGGAEKDRGGREVLRETPFGCKWNSPKACGEAPPVSPQKTPVDIPQGAGLAQIGILGRTSAG
jgi:hypothetical protein